MGNGKIKSVTTPYIIRNFRSRFNVVQNLQFLLIGQWVPRGGFREEQTTWDGAVTQYKSMRTQDLEFDRQAEIERLDDSIQYQKSRADLIQYNETKEILLNISFIDKGKRILCNDIIWDVMDEVRMERKTIMALKDDNVDEYIHLDMTEVDI